MMEGWIKLHRSICDRNEWLSEPFGKNRAWVDLLLLTNHKPGSFEKRGIIVNVDRGQCGWSKKALSLRWQWSNKKVGKFLERLENAHQIIIHNDQIQQVLTIVKWEEYQAEAPQKHTKSTAEAPQKHTNKNVKNVKNDKELIDYAAWPEKPDEETLKSIMAARKAKRLANTQKAFDLMGKQLHQSLTDGFTIQDCFEEWVIKGWGSFKSEWMLNARKGNGGGSRSSSNFPTKEQQMTDSNNKVAEDLIAQIVAEKGL